MKLVLLPGLDGTGELFKPLVEALPSSINIQIVSYESKKTQSYNELASYVISKLPNEEFILLAESFSGPIAYQIALAKPRELKSIILFATFLKNPRPFLLRFVPNRRFFALPIPTIIIKIFFLGFSTKAEVIDLFKSAIKKVSPDVIAYRLKEISQLNMTYKEIEFKTTYIQASNDKLVPKLSLREWQKVCKNLNTIEVKGGHLILQANPEKCAEIIIEEVRFITNQNSR